MKLKSLRLNETEKAAGQLMNIEGAEKPLSMPILAEYIFLLKKIQKK